MAATPTGHSLRLVAGTTADGRSPSSAAALAELTAAVGRALGVLGEALLVIGEILLRVLAAIALLLLVVGVVVLAVIALIVEKQKGKAAEMVVPVASGLIAGESIIGVLVQAVNNFREPLTAFFVKLFF